MVKIILASHGPMADAIIKSCTMLYGERKNVVALCLYPEDSISEFKEKLRNEIKGNDQVLLLVDIPGGTPSNIGMLLISEFCFLRIVCGMNLMMVLEAIIQSENLDVDELKTAIIESGKESIHEMVMKEQSYDEMDKLLE